MLKTAWILARVDITGPVPMVVGVNYYGEQSPCLDYSKYRWWELGSGKGATYREAKENARKRVGGRDAWSLHGWANDWLDGKCKLPHSGR
jgi:hypothetical protein